VCQVPCHLVCSDIGLVLWPDMQTCESKLVLVPFLVCWVGKYILGAEVLKAGCLHLATPPLHCWWLVVAVVNVLVSVLVMLEEAH
jgi:hypothetical protein